MRLVSIVGNNFTRLEWNGVTIWFSFETPIAFDEGRGIVISENVWTNTTGKHMNFINPDKSKRIPNDLFKLQLNDLEVSLLGRER